MRSPENAVWGGSLVQSITIEHDRLIKGPLAELFNQFRVLWLTKLAVSASSESR